MKQIIKIFCAFAFFAALWAIAFASPFIFPETFNYTEQTSNSYNFTLTNNDSGASANFTEVNITLYQGFVFSNGTNSTTSPNVTFANSTNATGFTTLSWNSSLGVVQNSSDVMNNTSFSFNATTNTTTVGRFWFIVTATNGSGITTISQVNVTINDTSAPSSISLVSPTPSANSYLSRTNIAVNVTASDNFNVSNVTIRLYNSTGLVNSTTIFSNLKYLNYTSLPQGVYYVNVTAIDSAGNINLSSGTRTITLDTTAPVVDLSDSEDTTSSTIVGEIRITETGSGIAGECDVSGSADITTGSGSTYQEFEDDVECGDEESYTVTCTDRAGNSDTDDIDLEALSCDDDDEEESSGGGGGGAATTTQTWTTTFVSDNEELSEMESVEKEIAASQRIRLLINDEKHFVGLKSLTTSSAVIEISSTPQTAIMSVGQSKKFDVDDDDRYDLQVTLNLIASNKASLTIIPLDEEVPEEEPVRELSGTTAANEASTTTANTTTLEGESAGEASHSWIWAVSGLIVVGAAVGIYYRKRKHRRH